jgi:purine-binding chemotaxis protein CheW
MFFYGGGMMLAIRNVSLCSLRMGEELFGFDTHRVREVLGVRTMQIVPLAVEFVDGIISYRGEILMVLSFRKLLGLKPYGNPSSVIVLEDEREGELFGLAVDAMGDVLDLDENGCEENPTALDVRSKALFAGAYKMGGECVIYLKPELLWPMRLMELFGNEEGGHDADSDRR